ncbi:hypothetical protein GCM10023081_17210 [Arthrobacter ginkgonis]|uniref:Uncharacterized protein n=1 Tax=Arthrobacter ginkgonis TaxID=1630594 RepID=A0ABP7C852_9MICC
MKNTRLSALVLSTGIALSSLALAPTAAQAAPPPPTPEPYAEFDYFTYVDARQVGGEESTPVRVLFRYDLDLPTGSGPSGSSQDGTFDSYEPLSRFILEVGNECVSMSGEGTAVTVSNDAGTTSVEDSFTFRAEAPATNGEKLLGLQVQSALFNIIDAQKIMFDGTSLPTGPEPLQGKNQQAVIELARPDGSRVTLPSTLTKVLSMTRFDPAAAIGGIEEAVALHVQDRNLNTTLLATLDRARGYVTDASLANDAKAEQTLTTFTNQVHAAQRAQKITQEGADALLSSASVVGDYLPSCL